MLGKKERRAVHKDDQCGTMPRPRENGVLMDPTQMVSVGHATIVTGVHNMVELDIVLGT